METKTQEMNREETLECYRKAAEQGDREAQCKLGDCFFYGKGVEENEEEAAKWYLKAAEQGYPEAQYYLGLGYFQGCGVKADVWEAVKWLRKAADQGYADAKEFLGNGGLEEGEQYQKAAEQGDMEAQYALGEWFGIMGIYQSHLQVLLVRNMSERTDEHRMRESYDIDYEYYINETIKWYQKAAEQGHMKAQYELGWCYECEKLSDEEAVKWYRKAADQGYPEAQCKLGDCFLYGKGVEANSEEAVKWYLKAAEQGDTNAFRSLGDYYRVGNGLDQNDEEAVKWYRKAAEQGDTEAQSDLEEYYHERCAGYDEPKVQKYREDAENMKLFTEKLIMEDIPSENWKPKNIEEIRSGWRK